MSTFPTFHLGRHYNKGIWINCRPFFWDLQVQFDLGLAPWSLHRSEYYHHRRSPKNFERFDRRTALLYQKVRANRNYANIRLNRGKVKHIVHSKATCKQYQLANPQGVARFVTHPRGG